MKIDSSEASTMHCEQEEENIERVLGVQKTKCTFRRGKKGNGYNNKNVIVAMMMMMMHHAVDASPNKDVQPAVQVNKCCERFEILVDLKCVNAEGVNTCESLFFCLFHELLNVFLKKLLRAIWRNDFERGR